LKSKKPGGCLTTLYLLIISLIIVINLLPEKKQVIYNEFSNDNLIYGNNIYTILDGGENESLSEFNWRFKTSKLKTKDMHLNIEIDNQNVEDAMLILESLYYLTIKDLQITVDIKDNPELYAAQYWSGMYRELFSKTNSQIERISSAFLQIAENEILNNQDLLQLCITFVQNIEYKVPSEKLGIIPPIVSIAREYGDCDTVSILLISLLNGLGYESVIYYSRDYRHAMIGINTSGTGFYKTHNGKNYYFLEVTNPGWSIGQISSDMQDISKWTLIDL